MKDFIICNCNMIMSNEVKAYIEQYPELTHTSIQRILKIGSRCGSCLLDDSPTVEMNLKEYVNLLKDMCKN